MPDTAPKLTDPVTPPPAVESPRVAAALIPAFEGIKGCDRVTGETPEASAPSQENTDAAD